MDTVASKKDKVPAQHGAASVGIVDWPEKQAALEILFEESHRRRLIEKILFGEPDRRKSAGLNFESQSNEAQVTSVYNMYKKWTLRKPSRHVGDSFLARLEERLLGKGMIPLDAKPFEAGRAKPSTKFITFFVNGTYRQFYFAFPPEARRGLAAPQGMPQSEDGVIDSETFARMVFRRRKVSSERPSSGLAMRRMDQKWFYMSYTAVESWRGVIESNQYRQYEECKQSLYQLVATPCWREFFGRSECNTVVVLGAGAPTKDLIAIQSIQDLNPGRQLNYRLIDFSYFMLEHSFCFVDKVLVHQGRRDDVAMVPLCIDFMDLSDADHLLRPSGSAVCWMIPGGTIGNLREDRLFRSVADHAAVGDMFIVGAETIDPDNAEPAFETKYKSAQVREFFEEPLRSLFKELGLKGDIAELVSQIQPRTVPGFERGYSAVRNSLTVEFMVQLNGAPFSLISSTRYKPLELVAFASIFGFELVTVVESFSNHFYRQFVFRFTGELAATKRPQKSLPQ